MSTAKGVQGFNPTASPNGPVASTGADTGGQESPGMGGPATGRPGGLIQSDGLNSPRVTVQTIAAPLPTSPSASNKNMWPAGVASYKDTP